MEGRKYCQIRELSWFDGIHPEMTDGIQKETARQFVLDPSIKSHLHLSNQIAEWFEYQPGDSPKSGRSGDSKWVATGDPGFWGQEYRLTGWFELTEDSVWNVAHESSDEIAVFPTNRASGFNSAFNFGALPVYDFLDFWLLRADFQRLSELLSPSHQPQTTMGQIFDGEISPDELTSESNDQPEKAVHNRERATLYRIIATMLGSNYKPRQRPYTEVAKEIALEGERLGIELAEETLRKKLKEILEELPEAPPR